MGNIANNPVVRDAIDNGKTFSPLPVTEKTLRFVAWIPGVIGAFHMRMPREHFERMIGAVGNAPIPACDFSGISKHTRLGLFEQALYKRALSGMAFLALISRNADEFSYYFSPLKQHASIQKVRIPPEYTRFVKPLDAIPAPDYPLAFHQSLGGAYDAVLMPPETTKSFACPVVLSADANCIALLHVKSAEFFKAVKNFKANPFPIEMRLLEHFC